MQTVDECVVASAVSHFRMKAKLTTDALKRTIYDRWTRAQLTKPTQMNILKKSQTVKPKQRFPSFSTSEELKTKLLNLLVFFTV